MMARRAMLLAMAAGGAFLTAARLNEFVMLPGHKRLEHVTSPRVSGEPMGRDRSNREIL
jgi:hypothetical protein